MPSGARAVTLHVTSDPPLACHRGGASSRSSGAGSASTATAIRRSSRSATTPAPDRRRRRHARRPCRRARAASKAAGAASGCRRHRGETRVRLDVGGRSATGLHQVDNPVFRSRRQPVRHLQRHPGTAGAGLDLPRARRRHARAVRLRASSTRRRWPSDPTASSTSRAASKAPCTGSPRTASVEPFATDLGVACGLAFGRDGRCSSAIDPARSSASTWRAGDGVCDAAAERRGVSPRDGSRRALYVIAPTLASYDHIYRIDHGRACRRADAGFGRPQGLASTPPARCTSSRRSPVRAACTGWTRPASRP